MIDNYGDVYFTDVSDKKYFCPKCGKEMETIFSYSIYIHCNNPKCEKNIEFKAIHVPKRTQFNRLIKNWNPKSVIQDKIESWERSETNE